MFNLPLYIYLQTITILTFQEDSQTFNPFVLLLIWKHFFLIFFTIFTSFGHSRVNISKHVRMSNRPVTITIRLFMPNKFDNSISKSHRMLSQRKGNQRINRCPCSLLCYLGSLLCIRFTFQFLHNSIRHWTWKCWGLQELVSTYKDFDIWIFF